MHYCTVIQGRKYVTALLEKGKYLIFHCFKTQKWTTVFCVLLASDIFYPAALLFESHSQILPNNNLITQLASAHVRRYVKDDCQPSILTKKRK